MALSRRQFGLASLAAAGALAAPAVLRTSAAFAQGGGPARNVILFISDGAGFHTWTAASFFQYGRARGQVYEQFPVRTLMTTYPLNTFSEPTGNEMRQVSYDADAAWDTTPMPGTFEGPVRRVDYGHYFNGYNYVRQNFTDSAAAGTALSAGQKTYNMYNRPMRKRVSVSVSRAVGC